MANVKKNVLWAINDKCPYNCKYCYLAFDDNHNPLSKNEIIKNNTDTINKILQFISNKDIDVVFLAGAEPVVCTNIVSIIKNLKKANKRVVLCTNAILQNEQVWKDIVLNDLDAISISLDSVNSSYNNSVRVKDSWEQVVKNINLIKNIISTSNLHTKIGVYSVITKQNLKDLYKTYEFCSSILKIDYYIYQPITLPNVHKLYSELTLTKEDFETLKSEVNKIKASNFETYSPNEDYNKLMLEGLSGNKIKKCFIKNNFIFMMPNGTYSQCPCAGAKRNLKNLNDDTSLDFKQILDCDAFSEECTNIHQLLNFKEILNG